MVDSISRFFGYGNPKTAKIFFMGIEEHDVFTEKQIDSFVGDEFLNIPNPPCCCQRDYRKDAGLDLSKDVFKLE